MSMPKPNVVNQGKVVVEYDYEHRLYTMMLPDGQISVMSTREQVEKYAKRWAKKHLVDANGLGVMQIEWRNCPK